MNQWEFLWRSNVHSVAQQPPPPVRDQFICPYLLKWGGWWHLGWVAGGRGSTDQRSHTSRWLTWESKNGFSDSVPEHIYKSHVHKHIFIICAFSLMIIYPPYCLFTMCSNGTMGCSLCYSMCSKLDLNGQITIHIKNGHSSPNRHKVESTQWHLINWTVFLQQDAALSMFPVKAARCTVIQSAAHHSQKLLTRGE